VVLVVLLVLWTVLVVVWLDFMELINICWLNWRSLLPMVRFGVWYRLGYFCILSQVSFMLGLVRSTINQRPPVIFFERFVLLHRINRGLLNLGGAQLVGHHRDRCLLLVSRYDFLLV